MVTTLLTQAAARAFEYRMYFLAVSGFVIAGLAVTYGIQTQDTVAVLGALLFIPNALVLLGVGLREHGWFDDRPASQPE
jgi:hydrogenase-4 membrane subunit HyfE